MSFENPNFMEVWLEELFINRIFARSIYKNYIEKFGLKGNEKILDFGCGGGVCARYIAELLSKEGFLTCVDTSKFWLSKAEERMKKFNNVELKLGDISTLDIKDSSYDVVTIHFVLHDIEPNLRKGVINTLARKLKNGGLLFIREPTKKSHGMSAQEIRDLMTSSGLEETDFKITKSMITGPMYAGIFKKMSHSKGKK